MKKDIFSYNIIDTMIENYDTVKAEYKKVPLRDYSKYTLLYAFIRSLEVHREHNIRRVEPFEYLNYHYCIDTIIEFIVVNQHRIDLIDKIEYVLHLFNLDEVIIGILFDNIDLSEVDFDDDDDK